MRTAKNHAVRRDRNPDARLSGTYGTQIVREPVKRKAKEAAMRSSANKESIESERQDERIDGEDVLLKSGKPEGQRHEKADFQKSGEHEIRKFTCKVRNGLRTSRNPPNLHYTSAESRNSGNARVTR